LDRSICRKAYDAFAKACYDPLSAAKPAGGWALRRRAFTAAIG